MPSAARLGDLIGHAPPIPPTTAGARVGAGQALGDAAPVGGEGPKSVAVAGAAAASGVAKGASSGGSATGGGDAPAPVGVPTGAIIGPCSGNVFTNGIPAARAHVDLTACSLHPPVPLPIASGSSDVFINGMPAARLGDRIKCGAIVITGSGNVFIGGSGGGGGDTVQTDPIMPEDSTSAEVLQSLMMADAGAVCLSRELELANDIAAFNARNGQGQLVAMGAVLSFFTFNPLGRFMKGWAYGAADIVSSPVTAFVGSWNIAADAYGYGKQAVLGPERGVMGDLRPYQPQSGIINAFKVNGVANTLGGALHGTVMGVTGLSALQALGSRDPEAIGRLGPGIVLGTAGGSIASRLGGARSSVGIDPLLRGRAPLAIEMINPPGSVIRNAMSDAEYAQAQEIVRFKGGIFRGAPTSNFPGIDGWLDGTPVQLKNVSGKSLSAIQRNIVGGAADMAKQGYIGDLFIDTSGTGVSTEQLTRFAKPGSPISNILNEGTVNNVYVNTPDGWLNITQGTIVRKSGG